MIKLGYFFKVEIIFGFENIFVGFFYIFINMQV